LMWPLNFINLKKEKQKIKTCSIQKILSLPVYSLDFLLLALLALFQALFWVFLAEL